MREIVPGIFLESVRVGTPEIPALNLCFIPALPDSTGKRTGRSLLVDSGMEDPVRDASGKAIEEAAAAFGISVSDFDCVITHCHQDHIGKARWLLQKGARVFMNPGEKLHRNDMVLFRISDPACREQFFRTVGIRKEEDPARYRRWTEWIEKRTGKLKGILDFESEPLPVGSVLSYGAYHFVTVPLKGHTCGQIGLWEEQHRILFCADHIMQGIAPVVGCCREENAYLTDYLRSMKDIKHLYNDSLFIPGHGKEFRDGSDEADRIIYSYLTKCSLMISFLRASARPMSIFEIAVKTYGRDVLNPDEKFLTSWLLILAKTFACLVYMKEHGLVNREEKNGILFWSAPGFTKTAV